MRASAGWLLGVPPVWGPGPCISTIGAGWVEGELLCPRETAASGDLVSWRPCLLATWEMCVVLSSALAV